LFWFPAAKTRKPGAGIMVGKKLKEDYLTVKNIGAKTREWLSIIEPHVSRHRRDKFIFNPGRSALLIIDMQRYFLESSSHAYLPAARAITGIIRNILASYRKRKLPVIFTYYALSPGEKPGIMGRWWADVLRDGDASAEIIDELKPEKGEPVLRKSRYSAFSGTSLEKILKELDVHQVLITGVMTHLCCETTARDAFSMDYEVYFVIDSTATQYEELHVSSLRTLSCGFAMPVTTREVLACLKRKK